MARTRNIKPEFFLNERLAECSALARLTFAGLWTLADKAGRMEDRPKRIKAALLPYEECDFDALLQELHNAGFIVRYEVDGVKCLWIPTFEKHQRPHPKEPDSTIPAFPEQAVEKHGKKCTDQNEPEKEIASCAFPSSNPYTSNPSLEHENPSLEKFRQFWDRYPTRDGRKLGIEDCRRAFVLLPPHQQDQIIQAVSHYAQSPGVLGNFAMNPIRFIEKDWPDWVDPPSHPPPQQGNQLATLEELEAMNARHREISERQRRRHPAKS